MIALWTVLLEVEVKVSVSRVGDLFAVFCFFVVCVYGCVEVV